MTFSTDDLGRITQQTGVLASDGDRLGTINQVYTSDTTGEPAWVTLKTGLFGNQESFVPLADATFDGDDVRVPVTKQAVHDAPRVDADGHLSVDEEDDLYRYYGLANPAHSDGNAAAAGFRDDDRNDRDRFDRVTDDEDRQPDTAGAHAAGAEVGAAAGAAVSGHDRDDDRVQRGVERQDADWHDAQVTDRSARPARGVPDADDDAVRPGERTTQLRRYVVTERVVQTIEELPDEPSR